MVLSIYRLVWELSLILFTTTATLILWKDKQKGISTKWAIKKQKPVDALSGAKTGTKLNHKVVPKMVLVLL